jgi:hypothetical protein
MANPTTDKIIVDEQKINNRQSVHDVRRKQPPPSFLLIGIFCGVLRLFVCYTPKIVW